MIASYDEALATLPDRDPAGRLFGRREDAESFHSHKRRARKRRRNDSMGTTAWRRVLNYFGQRCAYCHRRRDDLQAEHVQPLSRGGDHVAINVVPACPDCNHQKRERNIIDWLLGEVGHG